MDGIFNIYKEKDYTSHDVVAVMRKILHMKRVGHAGTLDPQAEGVLVVLTGKYTKLSELLMAGKKVYQAGLKLGAVTDTQDQTGRILSTAPVQIGQEQLERVLGSFLGEYDQIPPMYSAVKKDGKKLYQLARKGQVVERRPKKVLIERIQVLSFTPPDEALLEIECSKGTYIRTLCHDVGQALGCGGYMSSLVRRCSGVFKASEGRTLEEIRQLWAQENISQAMTPLETVFTYQKAVVAKDALHNLYNGMPLKLAVLEGIENVKEQERLLVYDSCQNLIGIYQVYGNMVKAEKILCSLESLRGQL